jgi:hypothetical protein
MGAVMKNRHVQSPITSSSYDTGSGAFYFCLFWLLAALDVMLVKHFAETFTEALVLLGLFTVNVYFFVSTAVRIRGGAR